jgi:4-hydroxybenzoate polyprenyltransferase
MTGLSAALVVAFGGSGGMAGRLAACVMLGQLSIGWSNDARDAAADTAAGRTAKPIVRGLVDVRTVERAAVIALAACAVLSFALLGTVAGGWHLLAVAAGWAYNVRLKDTVASPLPYAVAFAAVPVIVSALVDPSAPPPAALAAVGALVGVAVHLANTARDVTSDRAVGRGGLACTIGSARARGLTVVLLAGAAAVLVMALDPSPVGGVVLLSLVALAGVASTVQSGRWLFPAVLAVTGVGVVAALAFA